MYGKKHTKESKEKMKANQVCFYGEDHSSSKLTWDEVEEIRSIYFGNNIGYGLIADLYGVSKTLIYNIIKNKTWVM